MLLFLLPLTLAAPTFPTAVTLTTTDGKTLSAAYGAPAKAQNGVVFVHMAGRTKDDWQLLASDFYRQGLQVLTVDLRGHGGSASAATPLAPADYPAMVADVRSAVAYLQSRGCTRVAIVGAELGANLALNEAADDPLVVSVVLLSPGVDYKGVTAVDAARRFGDRPMLMVAGQDDPYAARSIPSLAAAAGGETVQIYPQAGKGTGMFNRVPELQSLVSGFVRASWTRPAAAETAPETEIKVQTEALPTSGPVDLPPTPSP